MLEFAQSSTEAPDELVRRLTELRLCRPSDLRRARILVRRLSRDLPSFDSVWIDALVQLRALTPFQARILEQGSADRLLVCGHVVQDQLGQGPYGTTFVAKSQPNREPVVVKQITVPEEASSDCCQRMAQLIERTRTWAHPHLVVPHQLFTDSDRELVTVSRRVSGLTLGELLIRRGRFPAAVVLDIARQLASGLAALQTQGLVHGDLGLSNVRLTTAGLAILVDGGVRPALCPQLTIHEQLALEAYDGVAPELIGTGCSPNATSEIYALGCLLWQLLTGRPPYSTADPLMKLAAHQTQRIPDVRSLAPDTPPAFAELIAAMTSPEVNERPKSFEELLRRWGRPGVTSRSRLKRYRQNFDGGVPHFLQQTTSVTDSRWPWMAASLFVAAGMALTFADKGLRNEFLAITRRVSEVIQTSKPISEMGSSNPSEQVVTTTTGPLPLPAPVAGEIVLTSEGPYEAARVVVSGDLTIRGAVGIVPIIRVTRDSLWLSGATVKLQNVSILCDTTAAQALKAAVLVKSQRLEVANCTLQRTFDQQDDISRNSTLIGWGPQSSESSDPWSIAIRDSVFRTPGNALWSAEMPHQLTMDNCLKIGAGACVAVSPKSALHPTQWNLNQLTLRETGPLLRLSGGYADQATAPTIELIAKDCVFSPALEGASLIELHSASVRDNSAKTVHFQGNGCVITPGIDLLAAHASPTVRKGTAIDADDQFEGIVVSDLTFVGPSSGPTSHSRLENLTAPRSSAQQRPGIDVSQLPASVLK